MKRLLGLLLLLPASHLSYGQYFVYGVQGRAMLPNGRQIRSGDTVRSGSGLVLTRGSRVVLFCLGQAGAAIENKGQRDSTFTSAALEAACKKSNSSLAAQYFRYVWSELTHPHHTNMRENRVHYMGLTGGVSRGARSALWVDTLLYHINHSQGKLRLSWHSRYTPAELVFRLYDSDREKILVEKTPSAHAFVLHPEQLGLAYNRTYYWAIKQRNDNSKQDTIDFTLWAPTRYDSLLQTFQAEAAAVATDAASRHFMVGFMLESARFVHAAGEYYRRAARKGRNEHYEAVWKAYKEQYDLK